jgi:hypothetical protein
MKKRQHTPEQIIRKLAEGEKLLGPCPSAEELALRALLRDFSRRRPRWGWRRAAVEAKKAGWTVNHKRIHRLWIAEGLRVPYRKKKRPLRGIGRLVGRTAATARIAGDSSSRVPSLR